MDLKQDLAAPTYKFTPADKIQLESKDDIKKRGLPSPDLGDALALTFAYKVQEYSERTTDERLYERGGSSRNFDPLSLSGGRGWTN